MSDTDAVTPIEQVQQVALASPSKGVIFDKAVATRMAKAEAQRIADREVFDSFEIDEEEEDKPDYDRDIQWVYRMIGVARNRKRGKAPSPAAVKMLSWANSDPKDFFRVWREWLAKREERNNSPESKEMIADEKETLHQLRRLSKEITPDVEGLLRETAKLFPDVFNATMTAMGWVHGGQ